MIIAINQPTYFPWIGQFDLIDQADYYIFLDDVQIVKQSWDTRNKIITSSGEEWISVPINNDVNFKNRLFNSTNIIKSEIWKIKQLKKIKIAYSKSSFFKQVYPFIETLILENNCESLADFNINIIKSICNKIGVYTKFILSSTLDVFEKKDKRLVKICNKLNSKNYISPLGSAAYIEFNNEGGVFLDSGINLFYQNFVHPTYNQINEPFKSHLSIIDLLFNEGFEKSLHIIKLGRRPLLKSTDLKQLY